MGSFFLGNGVFRAGILGSRYSKPFVAGARLLSNSDILIRAKPMCKKSDSDMTQAMVGVTALTLCLVANELAITPNHETRPYSKPQEAVSAEMFHVNGNTHSQ